MAQLQSENLGVVVSQKFLSNLKGDIIKIRNTLVSRVEGSTKMSSPKEGKYRSKNGREKPQRLLMYFFDMQKRDFILVTV